MARVIRQNGTGILPGGSAEFRRNNSINKRRQSYRAGFLDLAAVFTLSPYQSRTLAPGSAGLGMAPSPGSSGAGAPSPGAKKQLKAARPLHQRENRAKKRAVFDSGPRCAARATAGLRSRESGPQLPPRPPEAAVLAAFRPGRLETGGSALRAQPAWSSHGRAEEA